MKRTLLVLSSTLIFLVALDLTVAGVLTWAETKGGRAQALVRYFEYGRSVPGKLQRWAESPGLRENLFDVAWAGEGLSSSAALFEKEPQGMVARGYGMSFLAQLLREAKSLHPELRIDLLGGPAAPPNLAYDLFLRDRPNRREGDVVVLGLLSSSIPAMASLSNRTWLFEQPAPLTYPIFLPDGDGGLRSNTPIVDSAVEERALIEDSSSRKALAWAEQLRTEDRLYTNAAFALPGLDRSPFARLIRRSLATETIAQLESKMLAGGFPYEVVLQRMVSNFAKIAREDGQVPFVYLIQSRDPYDIDIKGVTMEVLEAENIPYIATVNHADARDQTAFVADGHYTKATNVIFAEAFLEELRRLGLVVQR